MKRRIIIEIDDGKSTIVEDTGATLPDGTPVRVEEHFVFYQAGAAQRKLLDLREKTPTGEWVHFPLRVLHDGNDLEATTLAELANIIAVAFEAGKKNAGTLEWHQSGATWKVDGQRDSVPTIIEVTVATKAYAETPVHQTLRLIDQNGNDVSIAWLDENHTTHYSDNVQLRFNDKIHGEVIVTGYQQISMYLNLTFPVKSPTGNRSNWGLTRMRGKDGFVWNALTLGKWYIDSPVVECEIITTAPIHTRTAR